MELEKRKRRLEDAGENQEKKGKAIAEEVGDVKVAEPADEEVDEFFSILRRIQVAVKYFKERASGELAATPWSPSFEQEDFAGVEKEPVEIKNAGVEIKNAGLDLNSDPVTEQHV
ncbi:hypothetical protein F511_11200 [Dorcoceras hygrometricum]|uniref:Uncharacterized protein n=1 Tax=Dorcoceras hygrometricum TaxID=472368 RepID=A0A2Z7CYD7_9LAMI|nr:hypothetical protein F511_11200 [Dorcoceras hygrometricum]